MECLNSCIIILWSIKQNVALQCLITLVAVYDVQAADTFFVKPCQISGYTGEHGASISIYQDVRNDERECNEHYGLDAYTAAVNDAQ